MLEKAEKIKKRNNKKEEEKSGKYFNIFFGKYFFLYVYIMIMIETDSTNVI